MFIVHSPIHGVHHCREIHDGRVVPALDSPGRAESILNRLRDARLGPIVEPGEFGDEPLFRVHASPYLTFLRTAYNLRCRDGSGDDRGQVMPDAPWPDGAVRKCPTSLQGRINFFSGDACISIGEGTWEAARASAQVALTAADGLQDGHRSSFALCRPPGHHADTRKMAGYCFLNNPAIAAQYLTDCGFRVAILDVDYHHGNGTQAIFVKRPDVFFASIHADPAHAYPYCAGYADEVGIGRGEGYTANFPLPAGTAWGTYVDTLESALGRIAAFGPDRLVVSLGVDTYERDPIGEFRLKLPDFLMLGRSLARRRWPTLFVMEGGYATQDDALACAVANVLMGFEEHS